MNRSIYSSIFVEWWNIETSIRTYHQRFALVGKSKLCLCNAASKFPAAAANWTNLLYATFECAPRTLYRDSMMWTVHAFIFAEIQVNGISLQWIQYCRSQNLSRFKSTGACIPHTNPTTKSTFQVRLFLVLEIVFSIIDKQISGMCGSVSQMHTDHSPYVQRTRFYLLMRQSEPTYPFYRFRKVRPATKSSSFSFDTFGTVFYIAHYTHIQYYIHYYYCVDGKRQMWWTYLNDNKNTIFVVVIFNLFRLFFNSVQYLRMINWHIAAMHARSAQTRCLNW